MKKNTIFKRVNCVILLILTILVLFSCAIDFEIFKVNAKINSEISVFARGVKNMEMELQDYLSKVEKIIVFKNSNKHTFLISDNEYSLLMTELKYLFQDAREMPALGVSLDDMTRTEMKAGNWIELIFNETLSHNGMFFDGWLINVVSDFTGFNIIRKNNNLYDGRCFYVDLMNNKTMQGLDSIIKSF